MAVKIRQRNGEGSVERRAVGADSAWGRSARDGGSAESAAIRLLPESVAVQCIERAPTGGVVVPVSVVMADVRGYTQLAEGLSAAQVPEAMNRFYEASSAALSSAEALLGQIEGDLVMGVFVPGLAGNHYQRKAVEGGRRLLRAVDWLDVGVGIASGEEFVGNVGGGGFKDFTALGDVTNIAARLTAQAAPGEVLLDAATYDTVATRHPDAEPRDLQLKGKSATVRAFAIHVRYHDHSPGPAMLLCLSSCYGRPVFE